MKPVIAVLSAGILALGTLTVVPSVANAADPPIGTAWAGVQESGSNKWVNGIATNGSGTWVATTVSSRPGTIQRSTNNGVTWSAASTQPPIVVPDTGNAFKDVAWCNDRFIAVGVVQSDDSDRALAAYSTDGDTWTSVLPTGTAQGVSPEAIACNGSNIVAVGGDIGGNDQQVMTSSDGGATWTGRMDFFEGPNATWKGVTYNSEIGFVAVRNGSGSQDVMISTDNGANWGEASSGVSSNWIAITNDGTTFVAVAESGTNRVMTSTDGEGWTARTAAAAVTWNDVAYGASTFVAVASDSTAANGIMTSTDSGATWTSQPAAAQNNWDTIAYGGSPSRFVTGGTTTGFGGNSTPANVNYMYTTPNPSAPTITGASPTTLTWTAPIFSDAAGGLTSYTVLYKKTADLNNPLVKWGVYAQRLIAWPGALPLQVELDATPRNCGVTNTAAGWRSCPLPHGALTNPPYTFRLFANTATNPGVMSAPQEWVPE